MEKPQPIFEMASVLVLVRRAGDKGITRSQLLNGASSLMCIDKAIDCLKARGMIHRVDEERFCVTPDHREAPEISLDFD